MLFQIWFNFAKNWIVQTIIENSNYNIFKKRANTKQTTGLQTTL